MLSESVPLVYPDPCRLGCLPKIVNVPVRAAARFERAYMMSQPGPQAARPECTSRVCIISRLKLKWSEFAHRECLL